MSKLLDRLDAAARIRGNSPRTIQAYRAWVARFIRFHRLQHPAELGLRHIEAFLADLARTRAASTVNQAGAAIRFLYRDVLRVQVAGLEELPWARGPSRVPSVLSRGCQRGIEPAGNR